MGIFPGQNLNEPCSGRRWVCASEKKKSINPCQPAQSAQADMGRYFFFCDFSNLLHAKGPVYLKTVVRQILF